MSNDGYEQALIELSEQAEPIAQELLHVLRAHQAHPTHAIMACRMVCMCAVASLLKDGNDAALVQDLCDAVDANLNASRVISGEIVVGTGRAQPPAATPPRPEDAAIFDIDNWEKGTAP